MITRVEALSYSCLEYSGLEIAPFQVLVGPNASGKSTLLDVVAFMADVVHDGVASAVAARAPDVRDLCWQREGVKFELAVEAAIPSTVPRVGKGSHSRVRYELAVGTLEGEVVLDAETLWLVRDPARPDPKDGPPTLFPVAPSPPPFIVARAHSRSPSGWRKVVTKIAESGNDYFKSETSNWNNLFRLGPRRSALANLPEDEDKFPVAVWFRRLLLEGVQRLALNCAALRRPSPPGAPHIFVPDGSNLPWVIHNLSSHSPQRFADWVAHLRTALPDLRGVRTIERPEDRHRYVTLEYSTGLNVPSWLVSEGTLRVLALTILSYVPDMQGIFLIEEPENGVHPRAVEAVLQSLRSVYDAQVLVATHSPVILSLASPEEVLCFARTTSGATDIVRGSEHPGLRTWRHDTDLGTLFAGGVLG